MVNFPKKSSSPDFKEIIVGVADAVSRSQYELDKNSIRTTEQLIENGLTQRFGLQARWYAIPEVAFDLKMVMEQSKNGEFTPTFVSGEYAAKYQIDMRAVSDLSLKIRRDPREMSNNPSLLTEPEIIKKVSHIRKIAKLIQEHRGSYLCVNYQAHTPGPQYNGGIWIIDLVDPPDSDITSKSKEFEIYDDILKKFPITIPEKFIPELDKGMEDKDSRKEIQTIFKENKINISIRSKVIVKKKNHEWLVLDQTNRNKYLIVNEYNTLRAYIVGTNQSSGLTLLVTCMIDDMNGEFISIKYFV